MQSRPGTLGVVRPRGCNPDTISVSLRVGRAQRRRGQDPTAGPCAPESLSPGPQRHGGRHMQPAVWSGTRDEGGDGRCWAACCSRRNVSSSPPVNHGHAWLRCYRRALNNSPHVHVTEAFADFERDVNAAVGTSLWSRHGVRAGGPTTTVEMPQTTHIWGRGKGQGTLFWAGWSWVDTYEQIPECSRKTEQQCREPQEEAAPWGGRRRRVLGKDTSWEATRGPTGPSCRYLRHPFQNDPCIPLPSRGHRPDPGAGLRSAWGPREAGSRQAGPQGGHGR